MNMSSADRFYYGMCYMEAMPGLMFPKGGNIQLVISRKLTEATKWQFNWRYRYYAGTKDAWDGTDRKSQWAMNVDIKKDTIEQAFEHWHDLLVLGTCTGTTLAQPDWIMFNCPGSETLDKLESQPKSWLQMKKMTRKEAEAQGYKIPNAVPKA
jgi:hypothetical protein